MFVRPTDKLEILKIIQNFKPKVSTGDDGISMQLLKHISSECSEPLSLLINMSFKNGVFPEAMKLAKVVPIFKAKNMQMFTNYRPISLLSSISKIFEKVMHQRLYSFIQQHDILYDGQFGFRPKHSTIDAITKFVSDVLEAVDNIKCCVSVYLDLSKAFDTINHSILLRKLEHYGVRGKAHEWFKSYLSQRNQYVYYKNHKSESNAVPVGIPQGSVLGPLLFIIYCNDMPKLLKYCSSVIFADDTTIYHIGTNQTEVYQDMNSDLETLSDWFKANKLSVNASKTKYMVFKCKKSAEAQTTQPDLYIDNEVLEKVPVTKFLGVYIDENLDWIEHIDFVKKKISGGIYALNSSKNFLSSANMRTL